MACVACERGKGKMLSLSLKIYMKYSSDMVILLQKIGQTKTVKKCRHMLSDLNYRILKWLKQNYSYWNTDLNKCLNAWNAMMYDGISEMFMESWNAPLEDALERSLTNHVMCSGSKEFVRLYCKNVHTYKNCLQKLLSDIAFKTIGKAYEMDFRSFSHPEKTLFGKLLTKMFQDEWSKLKTKYTSGDPFLCFALQWSPFTHFLKEVYSKQQQVIEEECEHNIVKTLSSLDSQVNKLISGAICVENLMLMNANKQRFVEMAASKTLSEVFIKKLLNTRLEELNSFKKESELMTVLVSLCHHLPGVNISKVNEVLQKKTEIEVHALNEFCDPANINVVQDTATIHPKITAFPIPKELQSALHEIEFCNKSFVFINLWKQLCSEKAENCKSLEDVTQIIWIPVKERWDDTSAMINSGEITFSELENLLGHVFQNDYERIKLEMKALKVPNKSAEERIIQLKQFRDLQKYVTGAETILRFAKEFKLTGDFHPVEIVASHANNDLKMNLFDSSPIEVCTFLKDFTTERANCLEELVKCEKLINWLKETMQASGLKELKVFVDLAFMSAGDEPMNIARVQCLHSAVTGYAPLIFDLATEADYKVLLNVCEMLWKALDANPNLPMQLADTARHLEWFKEIEKAHGSVEVTSLLQTESINSDGIFKVGKYALGDGQLDDCLDLPNTIWLTVREEEGKRQRKNYTYQEMQDLQSRLMLVAGKEEIGNDRVERFSEIFDSVMRLGSIYIQLCSAGCVLFQDWTATFFCDEKLPVCAVLDFGQGEETPKLKGRRTEDEDLQVFIPKLANFMERCYKEWLWYIKDKRKTHFFLNFFTVDQLVILQQELGKFETDREPSVLIYPLLSAVKKMCTKEDLLEAIDKAKSSLYKEDGKNVIKDGSDGSSSGQNEEKAKLAFVNEIVEAGFCEKLAWEALKQFSPDEASDAIEWCMEKEEELEEKKEESVAEKSLIQSLIIRNIKTLVIDQSEKGSKVLLSDLEKLWNEFRGSISSNVSDYLNLEHLGIILSFLAQKELFQINRSFPSTLDEGEPNLIICNQEEVLTTALSIYMVSQDQPFPQSDELLLCNSKTSKDEVEIFWRRAIFDNGRHIHCLVNADLLDFDVSEEAEKCLDECLLETKDKEIKYRLIVICGSDNEYRSRIVASLDKYKQLYKPSNLKHLKTYVADKLKVSPPADDKLKPAGCVDFNSSSVRIIKSWRSGVGKSLYKTRREADLLRLNGGNHISENISIPLQEKNVDLHRVIQSLLKYTVSPDQSVARIIHLDLAHEVHDGADYLLFNLLVLGCLTDKTGYVWRKSEMDLYLIESRPLMVCASQTQDDGGQLFHKMLMILPDVTCRSPEESLAMYTNGELSVDDQLFDNEQFKSEVFQRPFQYLHRLDGKKKFNDVDALKVEGDEKTCLQTLQRHCGIENPSWSELYHFVSFLNTQLHDFEKNEFVGPAAAEDLPGFSDFVISFLIQMSRDFSSRSLNMSEESPGLSHDKPKKIKENAEEEERDMLEKYIMRRTWESSPHPYLFFNADRISFTFFGFNIDRATGDVIDKQAGKVLQRGIMKRNLYDALVRNHIPIKEEFDNLQRQEKIEKLCNVMGNDTPSDPDETYELTTDNAKKIMAIYMRFRCGIPVIIMGETGCGKTRLVKFMCALQNPPGVDIQNMIIMKVHGGTTNDAIIKKVHEAETIAEKNVENFCKNGRTMYTVLFFDEANTTESIGLIKEIICDKSVAGKKLKLSENLKIVAACNPYRKHSEDLIKKLEQAGLGYHVDAEDTTDKLGRVPMRRLVYRVQPLPQSLLPLVWDFGQLNTQVEELYIRQMVRRYIRNGRLPDKQGFVEVLSSILTTSQEFMRKQEDECSFVSLRDVERVLNVMSWFCCQSEHGKFLFTEMNKKLYGEEIPQTESQKDKHLDNITRSLVLALGVCYHACLRKRDEYRRCVVNKFQTPCDLPGGAKQFESELTVCQEVFLDSVQLEKNIAKNMALKENVFMMVVCIELRIPLFLVGKPGSSKSLAKTVVSDAMQGNASRKELFKNLKQAQMVSFQCSPLSTPDGIVGTFRQCAQFQEDKDLNTFVSIVVLDEIGLAEDSPRMPLKTLHPLLEDGCQGDETPEPYKKVAFIGISNWALDPAKMNRGLLVQRDVPDLEELINSARGICHRGLLDIMEPLIKPLAESYLEVFQQASKKMREFYGLRDFYSLVKMVYAFVEKSKKSPTWHEMVHSIRRNFGGMDNIDPVQCFMNKLCSVTISEIKPSETDPDCSTSGLIQACLFNKGNTHGENQDNESRYLLLLTENYGALAILQQQIMSHHTDIRPVTIFGSSFRSDQEYTQVCRNINKIKVCMETGNTVVLLNLENLYESLYDALNQYYVYFGGERYVDLGLGTHRVKCPVSRKFRLIVVAEKQTVYKKFPIPLINRLEKHFLTINTLLSVEQLDMVKRLEEWAQQFIDQRTVAHERTKQPKRRIGEVFVGYSEDTSSAITLHVWRTNDGRKEDVAFNEMLLTEGKKILIWSATPSAILTADISLDEATFVKNIYFKEQEHDSIFDYLHLKLVTEKCRNLLAQVTTHSKLLVSFHKTEIAKMTGIKSENITLLDTLTSFDTEQQFSHKVHKHVKQVNKKQKEANLLIIQCDSGDKNANLIACARYCVMDEIEKSSDACKDHVHVVFIIQLPQIERKYFTGFQCGIWHSVHIDTLYSTEVQMPPVTEMQEKSVAELFIKAVARKNQGKTDKKQYQLKWNTQGASGQLFEKQAYQSKKSLDVKGLLLSCVHSALSLVKDREENSERSTLRVSMLLKLLDTPTDDGDIPFLQGLSHLIVKLLREREQELYNHTNEVNWLETEASKTENLQKAGTFKRSCLQVIESKISPILAWIVSTIDTNQNLDILREDYDQWKINMWLKILNTPGAVPIKYSDFKTLTRNEVEVKSTGFNSHQFEPALPFSWLIYRALDDVMKVHDPERDLLEEEKTDISASVKIPVLQRKPLCRILEDFVAEKEEILHAYIKDFVHFKYCAQNEEEYMLVFESVLFLSMRGYVNLSELGILHCLMLVHMAYDLISPRLALFREINAIWPECSGMITSRKTEEPKSLLFKDHDFTFPALYFVLENMKPSSLDNSSGRREWLKGIHRYRPVVEKMIKLHVEDPKTFLADQKFLIKTRCQWSRVMVVKLFLENVCASENEDRFTIKYCMPLWGRLGDACDMKEMKSLTKLESFLKTCNKFAMHQLIGKDESCSYCEKLLDGPPIILPCEDKICEKCFHDIRNRGISCSSCPTCKKEIPLEWKPTYNDPKRLERESQMKSYQKRCNTFFMEVVSQLCFAENSPPDDEVLTRLLSYITFTVGENGQGTKSISVFDTGLDPTPVFRSFLLQLMFRTSEEKVLEMLQEYLLNAKPLIEEDKHMIEEHHIHLSMMIIQCLEDTLRQRCTEQTEVEIAADALLIANNPINSKKLNVEKLYGLAHCKMGLVITAKHIVKTQDLLSQKKPVPKATCKLIESAKTLCSESECSWPKLYLVKYICRCFGVERYQNICQSKDEFLSWVIIPELNTDKVECTDRYIVVGESYIEIREAVTKVLLGEDIAYLADTMKEQKKAGGYSETMLQLAFHRENTFSNLYHGHHRKVDGQAVSNFTKFAEDQILKPKETINMLLKNELCGQLKVTERIGLRHQGIQCLCVHFLCTIQGLHGSDTLIGPLIGLMTRPQEYKDSYFPTMPQDDLEYYQEAIKAAGEALGTLTIYRCPNNHPYLIGKCGKPWTIEQCKKCGEKIGGEFHKLLPGNKKDEGIDQTQPGHILGKAEKRGKDEMWCRNLTPSYCCCVRLLTHIALYNGALKNVKEMYPLFIPKVEVEEIPDFLWDHINQDLNDLTQTLGKSIDDVMLIVHSIICEIMNNHNPDLTQTKEVIMLSSKEVRKAWEDNFVSRYVHPVLQNVDTTLQTNQKLISEDKRLGDDPLLCLLYGTETQQQHCSSKMLQDVPGVWHYREPISLEHLRREFERKAPLNEKGQKVHEVLDYFLKEEHLLKALRCIPSIQTINKILIEKYYRRIDKAEVSKLTVDALIKGAVFGNETVTLLEDFAEAWDVVKGILKQNVCSTEFGGMRVHKDYCNRKITKETEIAVLMPTTKDAGLCSYALLDVLMRKQNDFLGVYLKAAGRNSKSMSRVNPDDITSADVISFKNDIDIMPLVLANCEYIYRLGEGTQMEYNFTNIERQIIDQFLFSKSLINVGSHLKIKQMMYRSEFTSSVVLQKLDEKIPQVILNAALKRQISNELTSFPELCRSIDNLDIAINFLISVGGNGQSSLSEFMEGTLHMETSLSSQKAKQTCEFQHARSLWLLLALQRSKMLVDGERTRESIFESLTEEFFDEIPMDLTADYDCHLREISVENLTFLVDALHQYILLRVAQRENPDDEDYMDVKGKALFRWLYVYVEGMDDPNFDEDILLGFSTDILHVHCVDAWIKTHRMLKEKGNRRD